MQQSDKELLEEALEEFCYLFGELRNEWILKHSTDDLISASFGKRPDCKCHLCEVLYTYRSTSEKFQKALWELQ